MLKLLKGTPLSILTILFLLNTDTYHVKQSHAFINDCTVKGPIIRNKLQLAAASSLMPNLTPHVSHVFEESKDHLLLVGKVLPILSKCFVSKQDSIDILRVIQTEVDWRELAFLGSFGWGFLPIMRIFYRLYIRKIFSWFAPDNFYQSKTFHVTNHVSQGFRIACGVYVIDILSHILVSMGITTTWVQGLSKNVAAVSFLLWELARFRGIKEFILLKVLKRGNVFEFYNRCLNYILYIITAVQIMDILTISYGKAVSTVFAFGGVGTLVFSLASKELAEHFLSGVSLSLTEKFSPGDTIICGDGTKGTVKALGLFHTVLQGNDEIIVKIPNTLLDNQKVFNLSKGDTSQVMQKLCFSYNDIDKIRSIVSEIRAEIKASCSDLIQIRVNWSDYAENYLVVTVDARFSIKPVGDDYHDTRQKVLEAIATATKRVGAKFFTK